MSSAGHAARMGREEKRVQGVLARKHEDATRKNLAVEESIKLQQMLGWKWNGLG